MRIIYILLITFVVIQLFSCTGRDVTDIFRKPEYKKMSHVQRKLKKAVTEAEERQPGLLDTTTHTKIGSFAISEGLDTTGTGNAINKLADSTAHDIFIYDTTRHTTILYDTVYHIVEKALQKERKIVERECNGIVLKDTITLNNGVASVKIWQQGDSLRTKLQAKPTIIKDCPQCPEINIWKWIVIGLAGGILITLFLIWSIAKIASALKK